MPYFERAIALDPNFAAAYASLYDARMQAVDQRREDLTLARQRYRHLIDRALELDPKLGAAYFARAMWGDEPHDASATSDNPLVVARERDFRQGAALDPSNGRGLAAYAEFLYCDTGTTRGRQERSEARLVGRSDITQCAFHGCRCSLSTKAASRLPSKKLCRCWSSIRTSFRRCSAMGNSVGCSTASWWKPSRLSSMPLRSIRTILGCVHAAMAVYLDLGDVKAAREVVAGTPQNARTAGCSRCTKAIGGVRDSLHTMRRAGQATTTTAKWLAERSDARLCDEDGRIEPGDCVHQIEVLFRATLRRHTWTYVITARPSIFHSYWPQPAKASRHWRCGVPRHRGSTPTRPSIWALDAACALRFCCSTESRTRRSPNWRIHSVQGSTCNGGTPSTTIPCGCRSMAIARFQAIAADVRRYVDAQRSELEVLRRHGDVPRRGAPTAPH